MPVVAIHQSQYIPWFPYFKKIAMSDIFVVMDNVQFQKNGVQNRNKIRNYDGDFWLTIPVTGHSDDLILDKRIAEDHWRQKHWKSISASYSKAPQWSLYKERLENLYKLDYATLHQVNKVFLEFIMEALALDTKIVYLSELQACWNKIGPGTIYLQRIERHDLPQWVGRQDLSYRKTISTMLRSQLSIWSLRRPGIRNSMETLSTIYLFLICYSM